MPVTRLGRPPRNNGGEAINQSDAAPHTIRHALANEGIHTRSLLGYLGHSNIQNTTRYTARFKNFWRD